jgi:3,4-dihydroxy-2-butanone 4-phosphate synthase
MAEKAVKFTPIEEAIDRFRRGEYVVVMDDESRENEGLNFFIPFF